MARTGRTTRSRQPGKTTSRKEDHGSYHATTATSRSAASACVRGSPHAGSCSRNGAPRGRLPRCGQPAQASKAGARAVARKRSRVALREGSVTQPRGDYRTAWFGFAWLARMTIFPGCQFTVLVRRAHPRQSGARKRVRERRVTWDGLLGLPLERCARRK